jgi:hypothetical protein
MLREKRFSLGFFLMVALIVRVAPAEVSERQVQDAIRSGIAHLEKNQKADGRWREHPGQPGGMTALCTLALINAGADVNSPQIQRAVTYLRSVGPPGSVYATSLQTMVFCAAEPEKDQLLISRNVQWLEQVQIKAGRFAGAWKYSDRQGTGDNSNSQFALLALHDAQQVGVTVQKSTWSLALDYWLRAQRLDGSWPYVPGEPPKGSMTCAGIASVVIAQEKVAEGDAKVVGDDIYCCGEQTDIDAVQRGLDWLGKSFSVTRNPNPTRIGERTWLYYYLYGVERVGRLTGQRFIGGHDWFREGAEFLVDQQNSLTGFWRGEFHHEQNSLIATSFALLFLSKGRRPIVISKLQYGDDQGWDLHRGAVQNLTVRIEQSWKRDLTWQTIDLKSARANDLLQSPVLFLSGRDTLRLTAQQKKDLQKYVNLGGFIFAEACCDNDRGFDAEFRALMRELFPDSGLRLLPPDHPVWYAEAKVGDTYLPPLYGIEACCRTSVVYCPKELSCYWELARAGHQEDYPTAVREEIEAAIQIGQNVVAYATNRELKTKLDRLTLGGDSILQQPQRGVLYIPKLTYSGGGNDAPNSLPNLLSFVGKTARMRVGVENRLVAAADPSIYDYPMLFLHGRRDFRFTTVEREALSRYLERGGVVFADAICGSREFADAVRREFQAILNGQALRRVPTTHALFSSEFQGFDLEKVTLRDPLARTGDDPLRAKLTKVSPLLEGADLDGRLAVILSPYDLSCALEYSASLECRGYIKEDAARIGLNVILFALQQ